VDPAKTEIGVHTPVGQELHRLGWLMRCPGNVGPGVEADLRQHAGRENMARGAQLGDGHGLALQIPDRLDSVIAEQLKAADVGSGQDNDGIAGLDLQDEGAGEMHADVGLAGRDR
jgi:hypothetical protein